MQLQSIHGFESLELVAFSTREIDILFAINVKYYYHAEISVPELKVEISLSSNVEDTVSDGNLLSLICSGFVH